MIRRVKKGGSFFGTRGDVTSPAEPGGRECVSRPAVKPDAALFPPQNKQTPRRADASRTQGLVPPLRAGTSCHDCVIVAQVVSQKPS